MKKDKTQLIFKAILIAEFFTKSKWLQKAKNLKWSQTAEYIQTDCPGSCFLTQSS